MTSRRTLVLTALKSALRVRQTAGIPADEALCVFDLAQSLGLEVRFVDIPSLEGAYLRQERPVVLVSSLRPPGRATFTCAHEIGHHEFRHGTRIDELRVEAGRSQFQPDELQADSFAGFLLMPKGAVRNAFERRALGFEACTPFDVYKVSQWLGVGYSTLIHHMCAALGLITESHAHRLCATPPKQVKSLLLGFTREEQVIPVDLNWTYRPVDCQVGDYLLIPLGSVYEGQFMAVPARDTTFEIIRPLLPGIGRVFHVASGWSTYIRVSRRGYVGRSMFRHLEEADDD